MGIFAFDSELGISFIFSDEPVERPQVSGIFLGYFGAAGSFHVFRDGGGGGKFSSSPPSSSGDGGGVVVGGGVSASGLK